MSEILWNIPSEKDWDMLEELSEKMENFPDSPFFQCWQHMSEQIKRKLHIDE